MSAIPGEEHGKDLPTITKSKELMEPKIPSALRYLERKGHMDLRSMILGDGA